MKTAAESRSTRPWWRVHLSTLAVAAVILALFFFLNVPGSSSDPNWCFLHGWPWVYALSSESATQFKLSGYTFVDFTSRENVWNWTREISEPQVGPLAADIALAMALTAVAMAFWEWRRRRVHKAWHFGLRELLAVMLVAALACGWWASWQAYNARQRAAYSELIELSDSFTPNPYVLVKPTYGKYVGPRWLSHIVGTGPLPAMFWQGPDLALTVTTGRRSPQRLAALVQLQALERLSLSGPAIDDDWLAAAAQLRNLRELQLEGVSISRSGFEQLASMRSLERITIDFAERSFGHPQLSPLMKANEQLERQEALTRQDIARLRQTMPHIEIVVNKGDGSH